MASHVLARETRASGQQSTGRLGVWSALFAAGAAAAALTIAVTTAPPRSGPFCMFDTCIGYPYTDAAAFVPGDYLWMYPALLIGPLFVVLAGCIHNAAAVGKKLYSLLAFAFAVIAAAALAFNYFIQLTVVQPALLAGETAGLALFSQYNPHGVFIALEDIGYLMLSVAFLFAAGAFDRRNGLERLIRVLFAGTALLSIGALLALALVYGYDLEYRYEVAAILLHWIALIALGWPLSLYFARIVKQGKLTTDRPAR